MNIIGDIGGEFDALIKLAAKMPQGEEFILVGDLVDRGPKSKEVVEWAMKNATVIMGNHEHMMVDHLRETRQYMDGNWFPNGGAFTLKSYGIADGAILSDRKMLMEKVPEDHVKWMESLPTWLEREGFFITHAPVNMFHSLENTKALNLLNPESLVWNRTDPQPMDGVIQVFGHNANWGLREFIKDDKLFAICLDDSWQKQLTGLNTKTMEIFQEPF